MLKTLFFIAAAFCLVLSGFEAIAQDTLATRSRVFKGQVLSVGASGVKIRLTQGGEVTVPRSEIVNLDVKPPPSVSQGVSAYEKGNIREARLKLDKVSDQYLGLDTEWAVKGILYSGRVSLLSGDLENAAKIFNSFLSTYQDHPMSISASAGLADIELESGNYEIALSKFQELSPVYAKQLKPPKNHWSFAAEIHLGMGKCLEGLGRPLDAVDEYSRVIGLYQVEPYCSEALYRAASLLSERGRAIHDEKVLEMFSELIENYPSSPFAPKAAEARAAIARRAEEGEK